MKFSVITINRNNASGLEKTIRSVLQQSYKEFEYIIVDGASSDGSLEVIKEYFPPVPSYGTPKVQWLSEPDTGIYNAMNKGIRKAAGDYLLFMNSGDALADDQVLMKMNEACDGTDIVIGHINFVSADGKVTKNVGLKNNEISLFSFYLYGISHQASFIKSTLFNDSMYDESLKINADWKFFLQTIVMQNASVKVIPIIIADYDGSGVSSTNLDLLWKEREQNLREVVPERIASDYSKIFPHYYEVYRIEWLLKHKFFYKIYRFITSLGMKIME